MEQNKILEVLQNIFQIFFKNDHIKLTTVSSANDIDSWDSLNHMSLMGEVERTFKIEFEFFELMEFQNVGDIVNSISLKLKS